MDNDNSVLINKTIRIITIIFGIILAIAGFEHGLFETIQGNKATEQLIIQAIEKDQQWWDGGSEEAFTVIPNFLITGIAAMIVSIFIVIYSIGFVHKKHGTLGFLLLFIILTLVGGGIGHIPFFITVWAYSTRITKPLNWWSRKLNSRLGKKISGIWKYSLIVTCLCWISAVYLAIFGYIPGINNPDTVLAICWSFLLAAYFFIHITYISGYACDINKMKGS